MDSVFDNHFMFELDPISNYFEEIYNDLIFDGLSKYFTVNHDYIM